MRHVFISYQRDDSEFVADLIRQIEDAGVRVGSDHERLRAEETGWRESIDQAIRDAFALLLVITPAARTSEQMNYEWTFALGVGVPVIPVVRETATLHPRLEDLQRLDFTNAAVQPWGKLLRAIREAHEGPRRRLPARSADRFGEPDRAGGGRDRPRERPGERSPGLRDRTERDRSSPFGRERDRRRAGPRDASLDEVFQSDKRTVDEAQMDKLYQALEGSADRDYRTRAAHRLGDIGDRAAIPHLIKALRDEDARLREAVAMALAKLKAGAAVPALLETLRRTRPGPFGGGSPNQIVMRAVREIGISGLPVLIDALSDDEPRIRLVVVILLGEIGDSGAVPALTGALRDPESRVRWKAADALGRMGDVTAVPVLVEMLTDTNKDVRIAAAWALGQIGH
ncbi:MAG: HEAT repeat domain-containing protein, partial [Anaerolineae bacterium]|nr:HEAT repeat domain-containing protein [Anaerolineae bacterium]